MRIAMMAIFLCLVAALVVYMAPKSGLPVAGASDHKPIPAPETIRTLPPPTVGLSTTAWFSRKARICSSMPEIRLTGTRGARRPSRKPAARTSPSFCRSAIRPATGATSWSTSRLRTRRSPSS